MLISSRPFLFLLHRRMLQSPRSRRRKQIILLSSPSLSPKALFEIYQVKKYSTSSTQGKERNITTNTMSCSVLLTSYILFFLVLFFQLHLRSGSSRVQTSLETEHSYGPRTSGRLSVLDSSCSFHASHKTGFEALSRFPTHEKASPFWSRQNLSTFRRPQSEALLHCTKR